MDFCAIEIIKLCYVITGQKSQWSLPEIARAMLPRATAHDRKQRIVAAVWAPIKLAS